MFRKKKGYPCVDIIGRTRLIFTDESTSLGFEIEIGPKGSPLAIFEDPHPHWQPDTGVTRLAAQDYQRAKDEITQQLSTAGFEVEWLRRSNW
jgi:hypothetical protein